MMRYQQLPTIAILILLVAGCSPSPVPLTLTATRTKAAPATRPTFTVSPQSQPPTATAAVASVPPATQEPSPTASPTVSPPGPTGPQFIAYVRDGQLLVTDVTGSVQGGTTQYTARGQGDNVMDLAWSPSGEFIAFVSPLEGEPHLFYIYALGQSSPTDLGPGSAPAWSPDSQSIAYIGGPFPDENIWITSIEVPAARQLTFEGNHAWGRPAFTPDGSSLIVTTTDRLNMGAQGNTSFTLEALALDGSGVRLPLPDAAPLDGARLPYDLRFSPDESRLAFSTSSHFSACASPGAYYVSRADGGSRQELLSPSLKDAIDPGHDRYHVGLSYAWIPDSNALVATGTVLDCQFNSPTLGQAVDGPEMSVLRLDGSEGPVIPGLFTSLSVDRSSSLIAVSHFRDIQDLNPAVEIYSARTGQLLLSLGPGSIPALQP